MQRKTRRRLGLSLAALTLVGCVWGLVQPLPYVIIGPGPAYNVISDHPGDVMLNVSGITPTDNPGTLDMLTVSIWGTPRSEPTLPDLLVAYLSNDRIVEPMEVYYPVNQSVDQVQKADRKDFDDSVQAAISVAKSHLDPAIAKHVNVSVDLKDVGGPSAGMMITLGIIEKATTYSLTGGKLIAGTGTISADGTVGPIGGIQFKLLSAKRAGDDFFLAPKQNCDQVVGRIPGGLKVFAVSNIDDALNILKVISSDGDTKNLPVCSAE